MKHKLVKRVVALALSFTMVLALLVPMTVSASCANCFVFDSEQLVGNRWEQWSNMVAPQLQDREAVANALIDYMEAILENHRDVVVNDTWILGQIDGNTIGDVLDAPERPGGGRAAGVLLNLINGHSAGGFSAHFVFAYCEYCGDIDPDAVEAPDLRLDFGFGAGIIYNMLEDADHVQAMELGSSSTSVAGISFMGDAGSILVTVVPNPYGGNALQVTGRSETWHSIDFNWAMFRFSADGEYTVQVIGSTAPGGNFIISNGLGVQIGDGAAPEGANNEFSFTQSFTVSNGDIIVPGGDVMTGGYMRMRPGNSIADYTIYQIAIVAGGAANLPALPAREGTDEVPAAPGDEPDPAPGDDPAPPVEPDPTPYDPAPPAAQDTVIVLTIGSTTAYVNGTAYTLAVAPFVDAGRTLVPARFISDHVPGASISWQRPNAVLTTPDGSTVTLTEGVERTPGLGATTVRYASTWVPFREIANIIGAGIGTSRDAQNRVVVTFTIAG